LFSQPLREKCTNGTGEEPKGFILSVFAPRDKETTMHDIAIGYWIGSIFTSVAMVVILYLLGRRY
jgi:hypothetical protein